MISSDRILRAIEILAAVDGILFDPRSLAEDVVGVAAAFPDQADFDAAIAATARMLSRIASGNVDVSSLADDYEGWECCHYQHRIAQGTRATMRIMFARGDDGVRIRGFGNRRLPEDFYRRMAEMSRMPLG